MKRIGILFLSSLTYCTSTFGATAAEPNQRAAAAAVAYGKLPLSFERNQGQADPRIRFTSRGNGYSLALTDSGAMLSLSKSKSIAKPGGPSLPDVPAMDVIHMDYVSPTPRPKVAGVDQMSGTANYLLGNDASKWHANVPTYSQVRYTGVYPGVDLVYYGNQQQLEYDFVLAPHADPARVKLHFSGAEKLKLERNGDLTISAKNGFIAFHRPVVYQVRDGQKQIVLAHYELLRGKTVGFALASYDHSRELVIDPTLAYSTYLGGSHADAVRAITVDARGNVYLTGTTNSSDFPVTSGAFQKQQAGAFSTAFVAKMNAAGNGLVYSTFLGGNLEDISNAIAVDAQGNAYVAGFTLSSTFPVTAGSFQAKRTSNFGGAFVTKLNPTGSGLIYSTYLSGTQAGSAFVPVLDQVNAIVLDAAGDAYVTGSANSADFPVTSGAFQKINKAGALSLTNPEAGLSATNAFVTEFNPSGSALLYSSYLGGSGNGSSTNTQFETVGDLGNGIAVDLANNVYVTGRTNSDDFPVTRDALQKTNQAFSNHGANAFVTKINPLQPNPVYSTYLGGSGFFDSTIPGNILLAPGESGNAIAVDADGRAFIAGSATSTDFPVTAGALQKTNNAGGIHGSNAMIAKINPMGSALEFSTYLGGSGVQDPFGKPQGETANGIAIDADGSVYAAGTAWSADLPVTKDAFQSHNNAAGLGLNNAFVTKLDPSGTSLRYSTYLGGSGLAAGDFVAQSGGDSGLAMALGTNGDVYVGGLAISPDYPVSRDAFQKINKEQETGDAATNGFVAKFSIGGLKAQSTTTTLTASGNPQPAGAKVTFRAHVASASGSAVPTGLLYVSVNGQFFAELPLDRTGRATYTSEPLPAGCYNIAVTYSGDKEDGPSRATLVEVVKPKK